MARLIPISGLAAKGPACFLVETGSARLLLDLGEGPQPGLLPDIAAIGRVDAVLLSHQHGDHVGALRFLPEIGNPPVYATAPVGRAIAKLCPTLPLPLRGAAEICGITVRTGLSGHAPGGVWLHLGVGDGLLYTGDYCVESILYPFVPVPEAAILLIDASYGAYDQPFSDCWAALEEAVTGPRCTLLPMTAQGRSSEIALHLLRRGFRPILDGPVLAAVQALAGPDAECVFPEALQELRRLAADPGSTEKLEGIILTAPATGEGALMQRALSAIEQGEDINVVLTGYVPPESSADKLARAGKARFVRWNIHPRLRDNAELARAVKPWLVLPGFGDAQALPAWEKAFTPARVQIEGAVEF